MTVKNYGLMWDRECVHWGGTKGNPGRLMGFGPIGSAKKNQNDVDFREQIGVYILYWGEKVIYVGQAGVGDSTLFSRLKDHLEDHLADRWDRFSWFGVRSVNKTGKLSKAKGVLSRKINSSQILDLLEGLLINVVEPPLNRQGAKWSKIEQYYQYQEAWFAWSDRELLIALAKEQGVDPG